MHPLLMVLGLLAYGREAKRSEDAEAARLSRVVRRVLYCNGTLSDYNATDLRGIFESNMNSRSSDAVPSFYYHGRWDVESFTRQRAYPWPDAMHESGLVRLHDWVKAEKFTGLIRSAAWLPDCLPELVPEYPPRRMNYGNTRMCTALRIGHCGRELMVGIIDCESHLQVQQLEQAFGPVHARQDPPGAPHDLRPFMVTVFMADFYEKEGCHGFVNMDTMKVTFCTRTRMRETLEEGLVNGVAEGAAWVQAASNDADLVRAAAERGFVAFRQENKEGMSLAKEDNGSLLCAALNPHQEAVMRRFATWMQFTYAHMGLDLVPEEPYTSITDGP